MVKLGSDALRPTLRIDIPWLCLFGAFVVCLFAVDCFAFILEKGLL